MHQNTLSLVCAAICAFTPFARAQDEMPAPAPAPELEKLEPLIGNWQGKGVFNEPQAGAIPWTASGGYKWSHDGFWLQEDFTIEFEGMDQPMVFRAYHGWDAENKRYVNVHVSNNGEVGLDEAKVSEGTITTMMVREMEGMSYCERASSKVEGDKMTMKIDFLMPDGPSMTVVEGSFQRVDSETASVLGAGGFGPPVENMDKLFRGAGVYDVKGEMIPAPGAPAMKIYGTDTFQKIFGGAVMHGHTDGAAEGMPGKYESDAFWGYDTKRGCYVSVFVSNMGEVGKMDMFPSADGKQLISTAAATMMGQPMVQRFVLDLATDGSYTRGVGHAMMGTAPPMVTFEATYKKK